jgi:predicted transcriptional regulator
MDIQLTPEVQAKLDRLAAETGVARNEFVQDALAGYFDELGEVRAIIGRRFDDVKSGRVTAIPSEQVASRMSGLSTSRRSRQ